MECHPALVGDDCLRFRDRLRGRLEVAMGLETVHPQILDKLNKRMTLDQFAAAADRLRTNGIDLRVFILRQASVHGGIRSGGMGCAFYRFCDGVRGDRRDGHPDASGQRSDGSPGRPGRLRAAFSGSIGSGSGVWDRVGRRSRFCRSVGRAADRALRVVQRRSHCATAPDES